MILKKMITKFRYIIALKSLKNYNNDALYKDFICPNPFLFANLGEKGKFSFCCFHNSFTGNFFDTEKINTWNSLKMQAFRHSILSGKFNYCDMNKCSAMLNIKKGRINSKVETPYTLIHKSRISNKTINKCIQNGKVDDIPLPLFLSLDDDRSCNITCPSCRDEKYMACPSETNQIQQYQTKLFNLLDSDLQEIWISGSGDPFAAKSYRKLLGSYDFSRFTKLKLRIESNGLLFNEQAWSTVLKKLHDKIVMVSISVDGATKETYEILRRDGNFETIINNLKFISNLPQRKAGMKFVIRMVVQKTNFREMKKFLELGKSLKVDRVQFSVLMDFKTYPEDEFLDHAVHLPTNPLNEEFRKIISDEVFKDDIVELWV